MGNNIPRISVGRMGIASMAMNTPNINEATLRVAMKKMKDLTSNTASALTIVKSDYKNILDAITMLEDSDMEIFMALFNLFDVKGNESIVYRDLVVGVVVCLVEGTIEEKLSLAFELFNFDGQRDLNRADLRKVLHSVNNTASYFGDNFLEYGTVNDIVTDVFYLVSVANSTDAISIVSIHIEKCVEFLSLHESVLAFINGEGTELL